MGNNRYTCDEHYFDRIDSAGKAYWLGFIAADGCVSDRGRLTVVLADRDVDHVAKLRAALGSSHPIGRYEAAAGGKKFGTARLTVQRPVLAAGLADLGVLPRKSLMIAPPSITEALQSHYWRGVFDGDGSIFISRSKWAASLTGSPAMVAAFAAFAGPITQSTAVVCMSHTGSTRTYTVSGTKASALIRALYVGAEDYLDRKYLKAMELLEALDG